MMAHLGANGIADKYHRPPDNLAHEGHNLILPQVRVIIDACGLVTLPESQQVDSKDCASP